MGRSTPEHLDLVPPPSQEQSMDLVVGAFIPPSAPAAIRDPHALGYSSHPEGPPATQDSSNLELSTELISSSEKQIVLSSDAPTTLCNLLAASARCSVQDPPSPVLALPGVSDMGRPESYFSPTLSWLHSECPEAFQCETDNDPDTGFYSREIWMNGKAVGLTPPLRQDDIYTINEEKQECGPDPNGRTHRDSTENWGLPKQNHQADIVAHTSTKLPMEGDKVAPNTPARRRERRRVVAVQRPLRDKHIIRCAYGGCATSWPSIDTVMLGTESRTIDGPAKHIREQLMNYKRPQAGKPVSSGVKKSGHQLSKKTQVHKMHGGAQRPQEAKSEVSPPTTGGRDTISAVRTSGAGTTSAHSSLLSHTTVTPADPHQGLPPVNPGVIHPASKVYTTRAPPPQVGFAGHSRKAGTRPKGGFLKWVLDLIRW